MPTVPPLRPATGGEARSNTGGGFQTAASFMQPPKTARDVGAGASGSLVGGKGAGTGAPRRASSFTGSTSSLTQAQRAPFARADSSSNGLKGSSAAPPVGPPRPAFVGSFSRKSGVSKQRSFRAAGTAARIAVAKAKGAGAGARVPRPPSAGSMAAGDASDTENLPGHAGSGGGGGGGGNTMAGLLPQMPRTASGAAASVASLGSVGSVSDASVGLGLDEGGSGSVSGAGSGPESSDASDAEDHRVSTGAASSVKAIMDMPTTLSAKLRVCTNKIAGLEYQLQTARDRLHVKEREVMVLEKERDRLVLAGDAERAAARIAEAEAERERLDSDVRAAQAEVAQKEAALARQSATMGDLRRAAEEAAAARDANHNQLTSALGENQSLRQAADARKAACEGLEADIARLRKQLSEAQRTASTRGEQLERDRAAAAARNKDLEEELASARALLKAAKAERNALQHEIHSLEEASASAPPPMPASAPKPPEPPTDNAVSHEGCRAVVEHRDRVIDQLKKKIGEMDKQLAAATASGSTDASRSKAEIAALRDKAAKAQREADEAKRAAKDAKHALDSAKKEANKANAAAEAARTEASAAKQATAAAAAAASAAAASSAGTDARKLEAAQAKIAELGTELVELRASAGQATKLLTRVHDGEARIAELMSAMDKLRAELARTQQVCRSEVAHAQRTAADKVSAAEAAAADARASADRAVKDAAGVPALRARLAELEAALDARASEAAAAQVTIKQQAGDIKDREADVERLQGELRAAKVDIQKRIDEAAVKAREISALTIELKAMGDCKTEAAKLKTAMSVKDSTIKQLNGDIARMVKQAAALHRQRSELAESTDDHAQQMSSLKKQLDAMKARAVAAENGLSTAVRVGEQDKNDADEARRAADIAARELEAARATIQELQERIDAMMAEQMNGSSDPDALSSLRGNVTRLEAELAAKAAAEEELRGHMSEMAKEKGKEIAELRARLERNDRLLAAANAKDDAGSKARSSEDRRTKQEIARLNADLKAEKEAHADARKEANKAKDEIATLQGRLRDASKRAKDSASATSKANQDASAAGREVDALREQLSKIKEAARAGVGVAKATGPKLAMLRLAIAAEMKARDAVNNMQVLLKAAENAEYKKALEALRLEAKAAKDTVSILVYNVNAAEKKIAAYDREAAEKQRQAREEQLEKLNVKLEKEQKAANSFQSTSDINSERLNEIMPKTKSKLEARTAERAAIMEEMAAEAEKAAASAEGAGSLNDDDDASGSGSGSGSTKVASAAAAGAGKGKKHTSLRGAARAVSAARAFSRR